MFRQIAIVLFTFALMAVTHAARACTFFPPRYIAPHEVLVARTPAIALVEAVERVKDPATGHAVMRFRVIEVLKGEAGEMVQVAEEVTGGPVTDRDRSDFNGHRDTGFWPATSESRIPLNRSRGAGTDCALGFRFHPGDTYLGFFEGPVPQHVHGFERIAAADDAWLARVRSLLESGG